MFPNRVLNGGHTVAPEMLLVALAIIGWSETLHSTRPLVQRLLVPSLWSIALLSLSIFALALRLAADKVWIEGITSAAALLLVGWSFLCVRRAAPANAVA